MNPQATYVTTDDRPEDVAGGRPALELAPSATDQPTALGHTITDATGAVLPVPFTTLFQRARSGNLRRRLARPAVSTISVLSLIGLWQLAVSTLHPNALAIVGPWQVVTAAKQLWVQGLLVNDLRVSGEEFGIGFGIALVAGVAVGVGLGRSRRLAAFFDPWLTIFYTVPVIAIAPMIIIGLGITLTAKVVIVGSATFFPILLNTQAGVRNLDNGLADVATSFRATRTETLRYVILPGSVPYILTGVRLGVGRGLIALVAGDLFGATSGIGYLILSGEQNLNTANVYVGVVLLSIIGLALTRLAGLAERHFASYRDLGGSR
jgi:ABC-type nitrate/sulfonate/bicarbonate transport system permease component